MIQVKEFLDTDSSYAEAKANIFLAGLKDEQVVNICYGSIMKAINGKATQRSSILVVYKTEENK